MGRFCCAFGCTNTSGKNVTGKDGRTISYHSFPKNNPKLLHKWVQAIRREDFKPTLSSSLCSEHFMNSDYMVRPGDQKPLLRIDAVPSVFPAQTTLLKRTDKYTMRSLLCKPGNSQTSAVNIGEQTEQSKPKLLVAGSNTPVKAASRRKVLASKPIPDLAIGEMEPIVLIDPRSSNLRPKSVTQPLGIISGETIDERSVTVTDTVTVDPPNTGRVRQSRESVPQQPPAEGYSLVKVERRITKTSDGITTVTNPISSPSPGSYRPKPYFNPLSPSFKSKPSVQSTTNANSTQKISERIAPTSEVDSSVPAACHDEHSYWGFKGRGFPKAVSQEDFSDAKSEDPLARALSSAEVLRRKVKTFQASLKRKDAKIVELNEYIKILIKKIKEPTYVVITEDNLSEIYKEYDRMASS